MDITLTIPATSRLLCLLCALASLTQLTLGCSQDFLDVVGPGVKVKRGPHWKWGNQDSNGLGTITTEISSSSWITVKWDNGHSNSYRVGHQLKCDLALVSVMDTQCNFFPTNITNTGDFLLSYQDFPRPVHAQYRCHKHIQSPDETKVVALHLMMNDICNTTIYSGSNRTTDLLGGGCDMVSGTYVASGRDLYIETFKELGTKYGFLAYVTYEDQECPETRPYLTAERGVPGYINSPYSKFTLGSRITCEWEIITDPDQVLELTITFLDDSRKLSVEEDGVHAAWTLLDSADTVVTYTSTKSSISLRYEKDQMYNSKGFQIVYTTKDKPTEASCPNHLLTLHPGDHGLFKMPEYDPKSTGSLDCNWHVKTDSLLDVIDVTFTRIESTPCGVHNDILMVNGAHFPVDGTCVKNTFSMTSKVFLIHYEASSPNNSVIIVEYKTTRLPVCYESPSISVDKETAFLVAPAASSFKPPKKHCEWKLVSPEKQKVSVEVISQTESDWEPYKAFEVFDGKTWNTPTGNKIMSKNNKLLLRFEISKQPKDFTGEVIVTYTAVSPTPPTTSVQPTTPRTHTTPPTPMTPADSMIQSSTISSQPVVECSQSGVPIWCYIVIALLSIGCLALFITSYTLYRRQIYVCDEHGSLLNLRLRDIIAKDDHL